MLENVNTHIHTALGLIRLYVTEDSFKKMLKYGL